MSKNLTWINKIFVINLERSSERLENCKIQAKKYNFEFERFPAIEGSKINREQRKYVHPVCKYILCTNGMIGCGLSHLLVLKKIIDEKIPVALVLEDDFIWREDTIEKLNKIKNFDKGIVKLNCIGPFCSTSKPFDEPQIVDFPLGNVAYLIRFEQAKQLYEKIEKLIYHIDFQYSVTLKINNIPIYYYPCMDVDGLDETSTIGDKNHTFLYNLLPLSPVVKWTMNEPFASPLGFKINLFILLSLILIITGALVFYFSKNKYIKHFGIILLVLGLLDIIYYFFMQI